MSVREKSPDAFRTISEASQALDVPAHVLRFWESKFPQISPLKRAGGRRFYRPQDLDLLRGIKRLLYEDGYTIKGARKFIKEQGVAQVVEIGRGAPLDADTPAAEPGANPATLKTQPRAVDLNDLETPASSAPSTAPVAPGQPGRDIQDILADLENARARLRGALEPDN